MQAVTVDQLIENFAGFMDKVNDNHGHLMITYENHKAVVLMSLDDFNAWQETGYLTSSAANAEDLLQAVVDIAERKNLCKQALVEM